MKIHPRHVRRMILTTFLGAMIANILVFSLVAVVLGFTIEDEILGRQVQEAAHQFVAESPVSNESQGRLKALDMTYYIGTDEMPEWLRAAIDSDYRDRVFEIFAKERGHYHAYVRTMPDGQNLYVLFNARRFISSTPQIKTFLMVVGAMCAFGILISFFFLTRMSRKVSAPLEDMVRVLSTAEQVGTRLNVSEKAPLELFTLADAIKEREARIQSLIERERQFNRDASHELRTPLAVASGAAEIMQKQGENSPAFYRMMAAIKDMQQLAEGILWLGRDPGKVTQSNLYDVCSNCISSYEHFIDDKNLSLCLEGSKDASMPVPEPVARVIVGNLIKNALSYTDKGEVMARFSGQQLEILDTGLGLGNVEAGREGFGVGLSLVHRLCNHFDVQFHINTRPDGGTIANLTWLEDI
jgi:signal transduction histidine kinase